MFERVKRVLGIEQAQGADEFSTEGRGSNAALLQAFMRGDDLPDPTQFGVRMNDPYCQSVAVFRCVNAISSTLSQTPILLKKGKKLVESGPYYDLINKPNHLMGLEEMMETLIVQILTHGNAFLYIDDPDSRGVPRALLPLSPVCISPRRGEKQYELEGWNLTVGPKQVIPIPRERVVHFKYASHPEDPIVGVGPLVAAKVAIETDNLAAVYNRSMLKNGGMPSGILSYKGVGRLTEEMKEEIRHNWYRTYGGPRNASRLAVTNSDWAWQQTGTSQKDMDFIDARKWNLAEVSRAFNVPLLYLNEESNFGAQAVRVQRKVFYEDNLMPLGRKLGKTFTEGILGGEIGKGTLSFDFSDVAILRDDFDARVEAAVKLSKMGFSINQINKNLNLGMDPEPWGDEHMVPVNMVPAQDVVEHDVVLPSSDGGEAGNKIAVEDKKPEAKPDDSTEDLGEDQEAAIFALASEDWDRLLSGPSHLSKKCNNKLRRNFLGLRAKVLNSVDVNQVDFDTIEKSLESSDLAEEVMPFLVSSYVDGAKSAVGEIVRMGIADGGFNGAHADSVMDLAVIHCNQRHEELSLIIKDIGIILVADIKLGIKMGENESELKDRIRKIFNVAIRKSSDLSRDEVFESFNSARVDIFKKLEGREIAYVDSSGARLKSSDEDVSKVRFAVVAA